VKLSSVLELSCVFIMLAVGSHLLLKEAKGNELMIEFSLEIMLTLGRHEILLE